MPTLVAIVPEAGCALVRDGERLLFVCAPFGEACRTEVPPEVLEEGVALHGYEPIVGAPDEAWPACIERIKGGMSARAPSRVELLARLRAVGRIVGAL